MYLFLVILVPGFISGDSSPSVGINLPHGSITFFGSNFGDSRDTAPNIQTSTPLTPRYVTSYTPNFSPFPAEQSNPVTFFKSQPPSHVFSSSSDDSNPSFFSISYSTEPKDSNPNIQVRNPSFSPFTQGPINSAVPFSLFYPEIPTTPKVVDFPEQTTPPTVQKIFLHPTFSDEKKSESFASIGKILEEKKNLAPKTQELNRLEDVVKFPQTPHEKTSSTGSQKKNLQQFWNDYNGKSDSKQSVSQTSLETIHRESLSKNVPSLNDIPIPSDTRKTRKIDFSSPSAKNITSLIKKALNLVKKVEEIDDRKRTLKSSLKNSKSSSSSRSKEKDKSREDEERIRDLKEDKRFADLKSFIQDQSSISNLIRSETSGLRDLVEARTSSSNSGNSKTTRDMIKALARLNSISSLLLKDNDKTKNTVRQLPDEIRNIVQSEIVELKDLLEDQNIAVASALRSAIRAENRQERKSSDSETEVVILKALAKLNKISGVLLKEQEKTEQKTSSALKALPALAKFIQAETSEIKDLVEAQADNTRDADLDELKDAISQSLANDKLITRAIIKLNDITQLLLKDVNFTTSAITNKLPEALTALITSETGKIRKMIDLQNDAIVDILKESDNLARAERVIQEAKKIKKTLAGEASESPQEEIFVSESDRLVEVLSPLISKNAKSTLSNDEKRAEKLIEILTPILSREKEKEEEVEETQSETEAVLKAQLTGQKSIVQALLKLTNITRTLLEDKEKANRERPRTTGLKNKETERDIERNKEKKRPKTKRPRFEPEEVYYDDYEEYYYEEAPPRRPQSLVERIATSAGNRALKGNQALFEEFVKLAIERQRWEQAQDVTNIIKSTLTTEPPPVYEYDNEEYESEENSRSRPTPRPKKTSRKPPKAIRGKRPGEKRRPKSTTRRPRTTTPEPDEFVYEDIDYSLEDDYDTDLESVEEVDIVPEQKLPNRNRPSRPFRDRTTPTNIIKPSVNNAQDIEESVEQVKTVKQVKPLRIQTSRNDLFNARNPNNRFGRPRPTTIKVDRVKSTTPKHDEPETTQAPTTTTKRVQNPKNEEQDNIKNPLEVLKELANRSKESKPSVTREDSPREIEIEKPRGGNFDPRSRGNKIGRGGISNRVPENAAKSERLSVKEIETKEEIKDQQKPKSLRESLVEKVQVVTKNAKASEDDIKDNPVLPTNIPTTSRGNFRTGTRRPRPVFIKTVKPTQNTETSKTNERSQQSHRTSGRRGSKRPTRPTRGPTAQRAEPPNTKRPFRRPPNPPSPETEVKRSQQNAKNKGPEDKNTKVEIPLNEEEKRNQKNQRNNLLKLLSKNRGDHKQKSTRPKDPPKQTAGKEEGSSALEKLFSIISSETDNNNDASKTVIKVTSSSSSSVSSSESVGPSVRIRPHGKQQGKRKKVEGNATPTEDPSLQDLTPQERLVKKVQETLRSGENKEEDSTNPRPSRRKKKKIVFRRPKTGNEQLDRAGRKLDSEGTPIKTVKVRVRRIVEPQPFPTVY